MLPKSLQNWLLSDTLFKLRDTLLCWKYLGEGWQQIKILFQKK